MQPPVRTISYHYQSYLSTLNGEQTCGWSLFVGLALNYLPICRYCDSAHHVHPWPYFSFSFHYLRNLNAAIKRLQRHQIKHSNFLNSNFDSCYRNLTITSGACIGSSSGVSQCLSSCTDPHWGCFQSSLRSSCWDEGRYAPKLVTSYYYNSTPIII